MESPNATITWSIPGSYDTGNLDSRGNPRKTAGSGDQSIQAVLIRQPPVFQEVTQDVSIDTVPSRFEGWKVSGDELPSKIIQNARIIFTDTGRQGTGTLSLRTDLVNPAWVEADSGQQIIVSDFVAKGV